MEKTARPNTIYGLGHSNSNKNETFECVSDGCWDVIWYRQQGCIECECCDCFFISRYDRA